jgi:sulfur carrier protein ThiS
MSIEIKLFGFGDDAPPAFHSGNRLEIDIDTPATPRAVLRAAGIEDASGLVLMNTDQVIPAGQWDDAIVSDGDFLTLLSTFEGG